MNKSKMFVLVAIFICLIVLFIPMSAVYAGDEASNIGGDKSLAGVVIESGTENISADLVSVSNQDESMDDTPDTSDKTPIYIISIIAGISFVCMAVAGMKEYVIK